MKHTTLFIALSMLLITATAVPVTNKEQNLVDSCDFVSINNDVVQIDFNGLEEKISQISDQPVETGLQLLSFAEQALDCFHEAQDNDAKTQYARAAVQAIVYLLNAQEVDASIHARLNVCYGRVFRENMMSFVRFGLPFDEIRTWNNRDLRALGEEEDKRRGCAIFPSVHDIMQASSVIEDFLSPSDTRRATSLGLKYLFAQTVRTLTFRSFGSKTYADLWYEPGSINHGFSCAQDFFLRAVQFGSTDAQRRLEDLYRDIGCSFIQDQWTAFCEQYPEQPLPDISVSPRDAHQRSATRPTASSMQVSSLREQGRMEGELEDYENIGQRLALVSSEESETDN